MAIDNLPCELALDSSNYFSKILTTILEQIKKGSDNNLILPAALKNP